MVIFGDRELPTQVFVDEVSQGVILPGGNWSHDFAARINTPRLVTITARVCESVRAETITAWPPSWAADPEIAGSNALTDDYVRERNKTLEIAKRVSAIKKAIAGYPGSKVRRKELDGWLKTIANQGIKIPGTTCVNPSSVKGYRIWVGAYSTYGTVDRVTITLYVEGTPDTGYAFRVNNPTQRAY